MGGGVTHRTTPGDSLNSDQVIASDGDPTLPDVALKRTLRCQPGSGVSKGTGKSFAGKRRASALLALRREHQVAQLMLKGYSNLEISLRSKIPLRKVYSYARRVRERAEGIVIQDAALHHIQALGDLWEVTNHSLAQMNDSKQGWR